MKRIHYTDRYLLNPYHPRDRLRNRCGRNRLTGGHRPGADKRGITGTRTSGTARDGLRPRYRHGSEHRTPAVQRIGTRIEQGCGTCDPHQPFFRLLVGGKRAALSAESLRRPGRARPSEHHRHLHRQHPLPDEPLAVPEETPGTHFQQRAVAHILDGLRQCPDHRTGPDREHPWQDSPVRLQRIPARSPHECHYRRSTLLHHQGKGFGAELLAGGSLAEAGPFHQFHTGTNRLRHPVAYAQGRKDILPGSLSQSRYTTDKSHSDIDNKRQFSFMHPYHA